jgi:hypothetical protein
MTAERKAIASFIFVFVLIRGNWQAGADWGGGLGVTANLVAAVLLSWRVILRVPLTVYDDVVVYK